jgi:hypothetical protein
MAFSTLGDAELLALLTAAIKAGRDLRAKRPATLPKYE